MGKIMRGLHEAGRKSGVRRCKLRTRYWITSRYKSQSIPVGRMREITL